MEAKSRSRVVTWDDPQAGLVASRQLSGLEYLQKLVRGDLPAPPFARLLNIAFVEVSQGRAVFAIDPSEEHYNAIGTVHGGSPPPFAIPRWGARCILYRPSAGATPRSISRSGTSDRF